MRGAKFGSAQRTTKIKKSCDPGPGSYNVSTTLFKKPGKTIAGRRRSHTIDVCPGPGSYDIRQNKGIAYSLRGRFESNTTRKEN